MAQAKPDGPRLSYVEEAYDRVVDFLYREAEALDERRHEDWLAMLTDDIRYRVPVRVTRARWLDEATLSDMAHFDEDRYSLTKRVERFRTEHAWAEDPPSRTRRFVTNIRARWLDKDEVEARSNLLLFRSRGDLYEPDLVSATRADRLRLDGADVRLAEREVTLDEAVLRTQNLAVFL
jgi:phthalate 3,4-dioxygenase subunit beta